MSLVFLIIAGLGTQSVLFQFLHTVGPDLWGFIVWREVECDFLAELQKHSTHKKIHYPHATPINKAATADLSSIGIRGHSDPFGG